MRFSMFAFGPLGFFIRIFWKVFKKYWWCLLIAIYLFRHPLISKPLCRWLEKKIQASSGMTIKIDKIQGNYITGLQLQHIRLENKDHSTIHCLNIEQIGFSYNLLAPLFGKKIFREIFVEKPNIEISLDNETNSQEQKNILDIVRDVDWSILIDNGPSIRICQGNIRYQQAGRTVSITNLNLHTSSQNGLVEFSKFSWHDDKRAQEFGKFHLSWQWQDRVLAMDCLEVEIPGYGQSLHLTSPLRLDLRNPRTTQGELYFPLPKGGYLKGNADWEKGCHWELHKGEFALGELLPWIAVWKSDIPEFSAYLHTQIALDWPEWDLEKFSGYIGLKISRSDISPQWNFSLGQTGLHTEVWLEDLDLLAPWLQLFISQAKDLKIAGGVKLYQHTELTLHSPKELHNDTTKNQDNYGITKIQTSGHIQGSQLQCSILPQQTDLDFEWRCHAQTVEKKIVLEDIMLSAFHTKWNVNGCIQDKGNQSQRSSISGKGQGESLRPMIPANTPVEASWHTNWNLTCDTVPQSPYLTKLEIQQNITCPTLAIGKYAFQDINVQYNLNMQEKSLVLPNVSLFWNQEKIVQADISLHSPNSLSSLHSNIDIRGRSHFEIQLKNVHEKIQQYYPELAKYFSGNVKVNIDIQEMLYKNTSDWKVAGDVSIILDNCSIQIDKKQWKFQECTLHIAFAATHEGISISKAELTLEKCCTLLARAKLSWNFETWAEANIQLCVLDANTLANIVKIPLPISCKSLTYSLNTKFIPSCILAQKFNANNHSAVWSIFVDDLVWQDKKYGDWKITCQNKIQGNTIIFPKMSVYWDAKEIVSLKGRFDHRTTVWQTQGLAQLASLEKILHMLGVHIPTPWKIGAYSLAWNLSGTIQPALTCTGYTQHTFHNGYSQKNKNLSPSLQSLAMHWSTGNIHIPFTYQQNIIQITNMKASIDTDIDCTLNVTLDLVLEKFVCNLMTNVTGIMQKISNHLPKDTIPNLIISTDTQGSWNKTNFGIQSHGKCLVKDGLLVKRDFRELVLRWQCEYRDNIAKNLLITLQIDSQELITVTGQVAPPEQKETSVKIESNLAKILELWGKILLGEKNAKQWQPPNSLPLQIIWQDKNIAQDNMLGEIHIARVKYQDWQLRDTTVIASYKDAQIKSSIEGYLNGGKFSVQGEFALGDFPQKFGATLKGTKVLAYRNDRISSRANLDLQLEGSRINAGKTKAKLSGTIEIVDVEIQQEMSLQQSGERVEVQPGLNIPGLELALDLAMLFPSIHLKNNLLDISCNGKMDIQGTMAQPKIKGHISTSDGKLFLPQGIMTIRECLIRFQPEDPLVPYVQIKAETNVQDYRVFVRISGRWGDLLIEFSSSPPLAQEDILMLLMTGATRKELQESTGQKLKETGSFILMQQFLNSMGIGSYLSAQITEESATITIMPPNWHGFALQGKVLKEGQIRLRVIYRLEYK